MDLASEPKFRIGGLTIRPSTREIVFAGGRETIEPRVMEVLLVLARAGGEVVSRDRLIEQCWDGRAVSEDAINRVISRIRKVSDLTGGRDFTLETIPKVGYRLQAAPAADAPAPAMESAPTIQKPEKPRNRIVLALGGIAVLVVAAAAIWWLWLWQPPPPDAPLTLAVLPFDDLGPSGEDSAMATGLSREIRNTLSRVRGLRVVSDASSFAVAAENVPAPEIGKRLNADLLIDGSLARQGDAVRLTAELVDGWSGVNLWTGSQSGPSADLDRLRQLMSAAIFEQLVARIGPKRIVALSPPRRGDPQVYRLVLEAREMLQGTSAYRADPSHVEDLLNLGDKAQALVQQALTIDPNEPYALSLMAQMVNGASTHEFRAANLTTVERQTKSADYLRRALASDPDNVVALAGLGDHYRRNEWRWADAQAMLQRALALDPNQSDIQLAYTYYLSTTGRCVEAAEHARSAMAIDPEFGWGTLGLPRTLKCAGQEDEANQLYMRQLAANPDRPFLLREIYLNHLERGDAKALRGLEAAVRQATGERPFSAAIATVLERASLAADALEGSPAPYLAKVEADVADDLRFYAQGLPNQQGRFGPDMMWTHAIEFAMGGAPGRAVDMIAKAVADGSLYVPETLPSGAYEFTPAVRADPRYQMIWRDDPRLQELVKMRLEAVKSGQMKGRLPDGRIVSPPPPKPEPKRQAQAG